MPISCSSNSNAALTAASLMLVMVCAIGCGESKTGSKPSTSPDPVTVPQPPATPPAKAIVPSGEKVPTEKVPAEKVELQTVTLQEYEAVLAKLRGKVVLVDFWATWCAPCRLAFPHSLELSQKLQSRGLVVVSVSIDQMKEGETLEKLQGRVLGFLNEQHATIPNFLIPIIELAPGDDAATDLLAERLDLPQGAVPHYKLFDREGNLHRKYYPDPETGDSPSQSEIDAEIEKLLGG